jgi:hypothetical protein
MGWGRLPLEGKGMGGAVLQTPALPLGYVAVRGDSLRVRGRPPPQSECIRYLVIGVGMGWTTGEQFVVGGLGEGDDLPACPDHLTCEAGEDFHISRVSDDRDVPPRLIVEAVRAEVFAHSAQLTFHTLIPNL